MKKFIILIFLALFFLKKDSDAQPTVGLQFGKVNSGIVLGVMSKDNHVGFRLMAGYSKMGDYGWIIKPTLVKQWRIGFHDDWYYVGGIGGHIALYNYHYYKLTNHQKNVYIYPNKKTFNLGLDLHAGIKHESQDAPITLMMSVNPFVGLINRGPEFIDYFNFTIEYRFLKNRDLK